jgi:hypothetical protein
MVDIIAKDERLWKRFKEAESSDDINVRKCFDHSLKLILMECVLKMGFFALFAVIITV